MKTLRIASLLALLSISLIACDPSGLPIPTPTAIANPTAAPSPVAPTAEMASPTPEATDTPAPPPSTPTAEATFTPAPTDTPAEALPTLTRPEVTRVPAGETATAAGEPTASGANEAAPTGGWAEVVRVAPGRHRIALTFDAGASPAPMPSILATLRDRGIHVTMFITGKFAEQNPDLVRQAAADGHELGNHTYSHLDSRTISDAQLAAELSRTDAIISGITGKTTKPYWRAPYGARNNHVLKTAEALGYRSIYWTLDSLDSVGAPKTPDFIFNRVTNTQGVNLDGAIILQHLGAEASAEALPRELDRLQAMGLQVVTISELLSP